MTVIVAGTLDYTPEVAAEVIEKSVEIVRDTRSQNGCLDYVWSHDPCVPGRLYVFERWERVEDLAAHLAGPHYRAMADLLHAYEMLGADFSKYRVDLEQPVYDESGVARAEFSEA